MILYRDAAWLVVDKPWGLPTHAARPGGPGAVEWLALHLNLDVHVVSRLDAPTSGALLLALDPAASARAQRIHEDGSALKVYEFLSAVDARAGGGGERWTCAEPLDGKDAATDFTWLGPVPGAAGPPRWRYRAEIRRGRHHQIRRHAAHAGVPLLGDREYGGAPWPRLCLHCREIHWPELAAPVISPPPASFALAAGAGDLALELAVCAERRGAWPAAVSDAWRLVHRGEIPGLPAAIDRYGPWLDVIWFDETAPLEVARERLAPVLEALLGSDDCRGGILRGYRRNPHQRDLVAETASFGAPPPDFFDVVEHGLRYRVSLTLTQHTGLFLDQRDSRRRVARLAAGRRLANLFAYTCSFSTAAVAAGAEVAFSVDVAAPGLETGKTDFELNGLTAGGRGKFIRQDARRWLERQLRRRREQPQQWRPLDLVVCDPPVFASSRDGGRFALEQEWPRLAEAVAALLAPGGSALFANNHRSGDAAFYRRELARCFARVTPLAAPLDYPELPDQPSHVRTYWCETSPSSTALRSAE